MNSMDALKDKQIILGVTGSIAAFKAAELACLLTKSGAEVLTIMTESALKFITPLSFESLTHQKVYSGLFEKHDYEPEHISLSEKADLVLVAPATANIIAKAANGFADDLLSCVMLATRAPLVFAPAMNDGMYSNSATQENIKKLIKREALFVGPEKGRLASGKTGLGRMSGQESIIKAVIDTLRDKSNVS
ncbi:MAG: flavoprotein [Planctomycetota bacterium]|jgi:phosphopantothenoylcysteine decarboxylase/phosphopantothenate--cysteine ligase